MYLGCMLISDILAELFNLECRLSDQILDHFCDELQKRLVTISHYQNDDVYATIYFTAKLIEGELRIDRFKKRFELCAVFNGECIVPIFGSWPTVIKAIEELITEMATICSTKPYPELDQP